MPAQLPSVEVRCTFTRPVDATLAEHIGQSLRAFWQAEPGYMTLRERTVGWLPQPHTTITCTSTWVSTAQAIQAAERVHTWKDDEKARFGWDLCSIAVLPARPA